MPARVTLPPRLARLSQTSNTRGRDIVLNILKATFPQPAHTKEIYQRVRKDFANEKLERPLPPSPSHPPIVIRRTKPSDVIKPNTVPQPPFPDHPIRSQKYLKDVILEDLAHRRLIKKVHTMRDPTPEELEEKKSKGKGKKAKVTNTAATVNVLGKIDEWGWMIKTTEEEEAEIRERTRIQKAIIGQARLDYKKMERERRVRLNLDWGHLNVRRQRARVGKLERENSRALILEKVRDEGRREAEEQSSS